MVYANGATDTLVYMYAPLMQRIGVCDVRVNSQRL